MKKNLFISWLVPLGAALALAVSACGGSSGGGSDSDTGSLSGKVTVEDGQAAVALRSRNNGGLLARIAHIELVAPAHAQADEPVPLEGALVELIDEFGTVVATTSTDEDGEFEFLAVGPGTYSIQVSDPLIEPLVVTNVVVLSGDIVVIEGTVTEDSGTATVDYAIETCGMVGDNPAQLGHAQALADAAEISVDDVVALREGSCLGWGDIAQELDVPPGTLGLGNNGVVGGGRPENPGPPDDAGGGRPDDAGPPEGVGGGMPDDAGGGRPDDAGPPEGVGNAPPN